MPSRLTKRDLKLLLDLTLSHVMSRDQIIRLGYFSSITRANTRLRELISLRLVKRLESPFFTQGLYSVTSLASEVLDGRVSALAATRTGSPRFVRHALMVNEARICLIGKGACSWVFEIQAHHHFTLGGKTIEIKPDGLARIEGKGLLVVEVDLGHVNPAKFADKLKGYDSFVSSGELLHVWGVREMRLLTLTTGPQRAGKLRSLTPQGCSYQHVCQTFEEFGIPLISSWS